MEKPKQIWFIRHGEAEHNVLMERGDDNHAGRELRDPGLSKFGVEQARGLKDNPVIRSSALSPKEGMGAELVVSSPCKRALQTTVEMYGAVASAGGVALKAPLLAHPDLQECGSYPCDTGRPKSVLEAEFPMVDFSELNARPNDWFVKPGVHKGGKAMLIERCRRVTTWLAGRPERRIIVVAHGIFFAFLVQLEFLNCEVIEMKIKPFSSWQWAWDDDTEDWREVWEVVRASDVVIPLYNAKGVRSTKLGSPPLSATLQTCRNKYGEEAVQHSVRNAGLHC